MDKENLQVELKDLEKFLSNVDKPVLSTRKKRDMKAGVFAKLEGDLVEASSFEALMSFIRKTASSLVLAPRRKAHCKENVFAEIERLQQPNFFVRNFFVFHKKFVSGLLMLAMFFSISSFLDVNVQVVRAETLTHIEDFSGDVSIDRKGSLVELTRGMELHQYDRLITGEDGFVSVKFFDDSVSRLSANTEVILERLYKPNEGSLRSEVSVEVLDGVMWSRVVNLVKSASFVVEAKDVHVTARQAGFEVKVEDRQVEVGVYEDVVKVNGSTNARAVSSGNKVVVSDARGVQKSLISSEEISSDWVKENLADDKKHIADVQERVIADQLRIAGVDSEEEIDWDNSLREDAALLFTFDDVDRAKKEFEIAERNFVAAQIRLNEESVEEAEKVEAQAIVDVFAATAKDFDAMIEEIAVNDEAYAAELRTYLEDRVLAQKRDASIVAEDEAVVELVDELESLIVDVDLVAEGDEIVEDDVDVVEIADSIEETEDVELAAVEAGEEDEVAVVDGEREELAEVVEEEVVEVGTIEGERESNAVRIVPANIAPKSLDREADYGVKVRGDKPLPPGL